MSAQFVVYLFAVGAGIVSAGLISSLWSLMADETLSLESMQELSLASPFRGVAYVFSRPSAMLGEALGTMVTSPAYSFILLLIGSALAFMQGVVIMTQVFGVR